MAERQIAKELNRTDSQQEHAWEEAGLIGANSVRRECDAIAERHWQVNDAIRDSRIGAGNEASTVRSTPNAQRPMTERAEGRIVA
jgi:hypothetical protein